MINVEIMELSIAVVFLSWGLAFGLIIIYNELKEWREKC